MPSNIKCKDEVVYGVGDVSIFFLLDKLNIMETIKHCHCRQENYKFGIVCT
jgi:hypothetical protein